MTGDAQKQFERLEQAFHQALDLDGEQARERFLNETAARDPAIGQKLRDLLANHTKVRAGAAQHPEQLPRFGAWQALRLLGRGGMGTVYRAERCDGAFQMAAAVKVVPLALASPEIEERFLRERQLLAMLDHPGIARLIDGGVSANGLPYLVMEVVDGHAIDQYANERSLNQKQRVALMQQVLDALAYVHSQQVLHRDLKPSNVLVDKTGRIKLLDFGISKLIDPAQPGATQSLMRALTPDYASPEQVRGESLSAATDIYSAGVLFRKLLTGNLDNKLSAILAKATNSNPTSRYANAAEMNADLGRYLEGRPLLATRQRARRRWLIIAAIGAPLLIVSTWIAVRQANHKDTVVLGPQEFSAPSLSADGKWITYVASSQIRLRRLGEKSSHQLTSGPGEFGHPWLSPNADKLLFDHMYGSLKPGTYELDLRNGQPTGESRWLAQGFRPRISPDGRKVAFEGLRVSRADTTTPRELQIVSFDQDSPIKLQTPPAITGDWVWSSDSSGLWAVSTSHEITLYFLDAAGGPPKALKAWPNEINPGVPKCGALDKYTLVALDGNRWFSISPNRSGVDFIRQDLQPKNQGCQVLNDGRLAEFVDATEQEIAEVSLDSPGAAKPVIPNAGALLSVSLDAKWLAWSKSGSQLKPLLRSPNGVDQQTNSSWLMISPDGVALLSNDQAIQPLNRVLSLPDMTEIAEFELTSLPWDVSNNGRWVLCVGTPATPRSIGALDTTSGVLRTVLLDPKRDLYLASLSPAGDQRILFTAERHDAPATIYVAPFDPFRITPPNEWIEIAHGDYPRWDPSGTLIYFLAPGGKEIESIKPGGSPQIIYRFQDGWGVRGLPPGTFRIGVTRNGLLFSQAKSRASVVLVHP